MENFDLKMLDAMYDLMNQGFLGLSSFLANIEKKLKNAPAGRLRIDKCKKQMQWYHVTEKSSEHGKYIPLPKIKLAKALAQKDYDTKLLMELKPVLASLRKILKSNALRNVENLYEMMIPCRQQLVNPAYLSDEDFVRQWKSEKYVGKNFDEALLTTSNGERVRSKSEVIIADVLNRYNVPYKYERPFTLSLKRKTIEVYPDFTCLNVRLRKEIVWEHFGKMDDSEYLASTMMKLQSYETNGMFLGSELICSMETSYSPFDACKAERLVKKFLL